MIRRGDRVRIRRDNDRVSDMLREVHIVGDSHRALLSDGVEGVVDTEYYGDERYRCWYVNWDIPNRIVRRLYVPEEVLERVPDTTFNQGDRVRVRQNDDRVNQMLHEVHIRDEARSILLDGAEGVVDRPVRDADYRCLYVNWDFPNGINRRLYVPEEALEKVPNNALQEYKKKVAEWAKWVYETQNPQLDNGMHGWCEDGYRDVLRALDILEIVYPPEPEPPVRSIVKHNTRAVAYIRLVDGWRSTTGRDNRLVWDNIKHLVTVVYNPEDEEGAPDRTGVAPEYDDDDG